MTKKLRLPEWIKFIVLYHSRGKKKIKRLMRDELGITDTEVIERLTLTREDHRTSSARYGEKRYFVVVSPGVRGKGFFSLDGNYVSWDPNG